MTVSSTLELRDSFSNTIEKIVNAVNHTVSAMEQMRENMESPINDEAFKSARAAVDHMNDSIREMEVTMSGANSGTDAFTEAVERTETAAKATETASKQLGEGIEKAGEEGQNASQGFMSTADSISQMLIAAGGYKILGFVKDSLISAASAAIEFESAVTGIYKTVDGTKEQLQGLSDAAMTLASQMPATSTEIAGVMEAAGQLGIATNNVDEFAKTMIDLGESTNLTSDAAASMLAKFANVTQMDPSYYENLGSTIVDLGNNFATTEADIVNMSSYLASAGTLAGFTQTDILGLSAAMSSVGIEAEAGGSAMSKLITKMQVAVETGDGLIDFANTADMTAQQFADTFENNAVGALQAFITGLNDVERNGASASVILKEMDLDDIRLSNTIRALASSNGLMSSAVSTASQAWEENNALANEANKRYETLESKIQMTKNSANNLKIAVGDALTPALSKLNDMGKGALDWLTDFAKENKAVTAGVTGFAGSIGVLAGGLTTVVPIASQATQAFMSLKNSMAMKIAAEQGISVADAASQAGSKLAGLAGKFSLVAGGISLAVGLTAALVTAFSNAEDQVEDYNGTLEECKREMAGVSEQYDAVVRMYGENSDAAKQLSGQLDTLNKQYEKGGGAIADYAQRIDKSTEALQKIQKDYNDKISDINSNETAGFVMAAQLEAVSEKAIKTNSDLDMMSQYASYLNDTFECDIQVNYDTGELTGFDPNDITSQVEKIAKQNIAQAAVEQITNADNIKEYGEAIKNAVKTRNELGQMGAKLRQLNSPDFINTDGTDYAKLLNDYHALQAELDGYDSKIKSYELTVRNAYADMGNASGANSFLTNIKEEFADIHPVINSLSDLNYYIGETGTKTEEASGKIDTASSEIAKNLSVASAAYTELYAAAKESFEGQFGLFDEAQKSADATVSKFEEAQQSQLEYWQSYSENISYLSQYSAEELGMSETAFTHFKELIASGTPEAAGLVASMRETIENEGIDAVRSVGETMSQVYDEQEKAVVNTAEWGSGLKDAASLAVKNAVDAANNAAKGFTDAGTVAMDNFALGIRAGIGNAINAAQEVANNIQSVLGSIRVNIPSPTVNSASDAALRLSGTYASGTLSAAPGLALVGENGPELVNFGGGEVVYTADQTRRILGDRPQNFLPTGYYTETLPDEDEKDTPHISDDDMKYLREMTEREVLNKIYQPQITNKIEMSNSISSEADIDIIIHELSEKLIDAMAVTAEGVHI